MKNLFVIGAAVLAAGLLAGCGHNAIQYGDGLGFDAGINPENYTLSLNLRYGKILSAVTRDNVEIEMTGKADADGEIRLDRRDDRRHAQGENRPSDQRRRRRSGESRGRSRQGGRSPDRERGRLKVNFLA